MSDPLADSLLEYRAQFPGLDDCVHLASHTLGCVPGRAAADVGEFFERWKTDSINAWSDWLPEIDRASARIAKIISAPPDTVIMRDNVSGVMALLASCFDYTPERNKIVFESTQFPTVSYVWHAEERRGATCVLAPDVDGICAAIDERTVAVPISHVAYSSSSVQDVARIVARAQAVGAHVILDAYQSAGTVPLDVVELGVSFATGGHVKWLCGGPGAAWLYVRKDLVERFEPRVTGWLGNEAPFAFTMPRQSYAENMWRYMGGTPAIAALFQAKAGQEIIGEIGVRRIRAKSLALTQLAIECVDELGFTLRTPREPDRRGGSVVFDFVGAADVCRELNRRRFFCDHRPGAGIRIGPHFYTTSDEIEQFFTELKTIRGGGAR